MTNATTMRHPDQIEGDLCGVNERMQEFANNGLVVPMDLIRRFADLEAELTAARRPEFEAIEAAYVPPVAQDLVPAPKPASDLQNGTYTIQNRKTGEHRTFRIRTQKADANFAPGMRVLALLTGSDNENAYTGMAFIGDDGVKVWGKKKGTQFETLSLMFWVVVKNFQAPAPLGGRWQDHYEVLHEGTCIRCNRKLTNPASISSGIGPECAQMI